MVHTQDLALERNEASLMKELKALDSKLLSI